jgi:transcriptional regulator with XRE-family HTH domain
MLMAKRLKTARENRGYKQNYIARKIGIKSNTLSGYESGARRPDADILTKLADIYEVSADYLLGRTYNEKYDYDSNEEDEKEIKRDLEHMINNMDTSTDYVRYNDGKPMAEEDKELLRIALESSLRIARRLASKKV